MAVWGTTQARNTTAQARLGLSIKLSHTTTQTDRSVEIWIWTKYSIHDTNNTLYYDHGATSATTNKGAVNVWTTCDSGGWGTANQKKLKTYNYTYDRGSTNVTYDVAAKLTGIDHIGSSKNLTVTTSWTLPRLDGMVKIYNGSGWQNAIPYVYNGSGWQQAIPYVYNGSGWQICGA